MSTTKDFLTWVEDTGLRLSWKDKEALSARRKKVFDAQPDDGRVWTLRELDELAATLAEAPPQDENCTCPGFHTGECRSNRTERRMSDIKAGVKELFSQYDKLNPKPPLPSWVASVNRDTGQIHQNTRLGLGDPVPLAVCITVWEAIIAKEQLATVTAQRDAAIAVLKLAIEEDSGLDCVSEALAVIEAAGGSEGCH